MRVLNFIRDCIGLVFFELGIGLMLLGTVIGTDTLREIVFKQLHKSWVK